jgi:NADH-quinone oxidoreductase subunit M
MPIYAFCFMIFTMANVGLPGTSGFVGEFLTLLAAFKANTWVALFATTGVILSASYALFLYRRMIFGVLDKPKLKAIADMTPREIAVIGPLVALTILFGFYPAPILDVTAQSVNRLVASHTAAIKKARTDDAQRVVVVPQGPRETPRQPAR